jgi:acetyl-CoA carboxylase, biotin carboxylase subunit
MLKKVLVANRGEIALRIMRACREMGIETVAVYSEADRTSLHVRYADEAYLIGPAPSKDSYLRIDKLVEAAKKSGADAIHPGYGFLAENANFAQAVLDAGLIFVGPPPSAIRAMGDKVQAKQAARAAGVPLVPGIDTEAKDAKEAARVAADIGYPVLIKAVAGGGGKGMRIVRHAEDIEAAFEGATREAVNAFGYGGVYIEKLLENVKHVEIQILADSHGNAVYLGERECSMQRRNQKMIEEAPSTVLDAEMRHAMGSVAVAAAKKVGYVNAGTIEFLVTNERKFYFMEMNTRLQVEHPVTEMITGIDVVKEQLRIAAGEPLSFTQADVKYNGWAIECRITAEDPLNNFLPSIGVVEKVVPPSGIGVRLASAVFDGYEISLYYDPMIAKLIVWAEDRTKAIARMQRALSEFEIIGVRNTIPFQQQMLASKAYTSGNFHTTSLETNPELKPQARQDEAKKQAAEIAAAAIVHTLLKSGGTATAATNGTNGASAPAEAGAGWKEVARREALRRG